MREAMTESQKLFHDYLESQSHKLPAHASELEFLNYKPDPNHPLSRRCTVIRQAGETTDFHDLCLVGMQS